MIQPQEENLIDEIIAKIQSFIFKDGTLSFEENEWLERYAPVFAKLTKHGFPQINYANHQSPQYRAYTATVMDLMLRNSRKNTISIMTQARKLAELKYGDRWTLGDVSLLAYDSNRLFSSQVFNLSTALTQITVANPSNLLLPQKQSQKSTFKTKIVAAFKPIIQTIDKNVSSIRQGVKSLINVFRNNKDAVQKATNSIKSCKNKCVETWQGLGKSPLVVQPVRAVKRYGLATLMFFSSIAGGKTFANEDRGVPLQFGAQQRTTMTVTPKASKTPATPIRLNLFSTYNGVTLNNLQNMRPEDVCMVFISSNKINAKAGNKAINEAKEFGPMLTKMSILQSFFAANADKYPEIQAAIAAHGINSAAFEKTWMKNYSADLMHDVVKHSWDKQYQPTFDQLAQKGFPKITHDNYASPEYFGYSAAVISTLGQTASKTAVSIMLEAQRQAQQNLGNRASLNDIIDASFTVKYQKWGLKTRYFGRDNSGGELALNQDARNAQQTAQQKERSIANTSIEQIKQALGDGLSIQPEISVRESTALPKADTVYHSQMQNHLVVEGNSISRNISLRQTEPTETQAPTPSVEAFSFFSANDTYSAQDWAQIKQILQANDISWNDTVSLNHGKAKLEREKKQIEKQLSQIATGVYKGMKIDFRKLQPENAGHVYESLLNPTIKDAKSIYHTNAMGLYQFNMSNTMKLLANELADEFPDLKAAKDKNGGCRNPDYEAAWKKYSTGPNRTRFERRQFEFMFDKFYQSVFNKLTKSCDLPQITKDNYNQPEYWAYAASVMSLINQNPRRSPGMMERAYRQACAQTGNNHPDLALVAAISYDIRAKQWSYLSSRYLGNRHDKGEKDLVIKVDRYLRGTAQAQLEQRLVQIDRVISAVDLAQNKTTSPIMFFAVADQLRESENIRINQQALARLDHISDMERQARNIQELRQAHSKKEALVHQLWGDNDDDQAAAQMRVSGMANSFVRRINSI